MKNSGRCSGCRARATCASKCSVCLSLLLLFYFFFIFFSRSLARSLPLRPTRWLRPLVVVLVALLTCHLSLKVLYV